jgi:galactoside O-acetyltransferase
MVNSFCSRTELAALGLKRFGENVLISRKASLYGTENITLGDNVRIDDFCILSGRIEIGSYVHIAAFCALYGAKGIVMKDFSGLSAKVVIYSASDDFSGEHLVGAMVPAEYTQVTGGTVAIEKYVQVGAGSIILPNVTLEEGAAVGAMSLVTHSLRSWSINFGIPARFQKERKRNLVELEKNLLKNTGVK